jgi:hypothetical protein
MQAKIFEPTPPGARKVNVVMCLDTRVHRESTNLQQVTKQPLSHKVVLSMPHNELESI